MCKRLNKIKRINEQSNEILTREIRNYYKTKSRKHELESLELEASIDNTPGKHLRSVNTLIRDGILTSFQILPKTGIDKRSKAIVEILCNLPFTDYEKLKQTFKNNKILIEIHRKELGGLVSRIEKNTDFSLYLSPMLETVSYERVRHIISHELCHVILHLDDLGKNERRRSLVEDEADYKTSLWGF